MRNIYCDLAFTIMKTFNISYCTILVDFYGGKCFTHFDALRDMEKRFTRYVPKGCREMRTINSSELLFE